MSSNETTPGGSSSTLSSLLLQSTAAAAGGVVRNGQAGFSTLLNQTPPAKRIPFPGDDDGQGSSSSRDAAADASASTSSRGLPHGLSSLHHYVSPRNLRELNIIHGLVSGYRGTTPQYQAGAQRYIRPAISGLVPACMSNRLLFPFHISS